MANVTSSNPDVIAQNYNATFGQVIPISMMQKTRLWPSRQDIQYGAMLKNVKADFHGLQDFKNQMNMYSSTNGLLMIAWQVIKSLVLGNASIVLKMFNDPILGSVGNVFRSMPTYGQVFAVAPNEDIKSIRSTAQAAGL